MTKIMTALVLKLSAKGRIDVREAFIDASFAPAKKGDIVLFYTCNRVIRVNGEEMELVAHTEVHGVVETAKE